MKKFYSLLRLLLAFVGGVSTAWADTQAVPQLSTDGSMHYYTIKNLRSSKYIYWDGDGKYLKQSDQLNSGCYFYFTAGTATTTAEGVTVMKIHNLMTDNLMADWSSWNSNGIDWYSKVVTNGVTGVAFGKSATFNTTDTSRDCWNDYNKATIGSYYVDGDGSLFDVEEVELPTYDVNFADGYKFVFGNLLHSDYYVKAEGNLAKGKAIHNYAYEFTLLKQENGNYKIYSSYLNKYVSSLPVDGGNRGNGFDVNVPFVESVEDAQEYKVAVAPKFGYVTFQSTQTNFASGTEEYSYLHMGSTGIVRWSAGENDKASFFRVLSPNDYESSWDNAIKANANVAINHEGSTIGYFSNVDNVQTALNAFNNASASEKGAAYNALETAINASRIAPESGKYYTIGSAVYNGKYIGEDYSTLVEKGYRLYSDTYTNNAVPTYWQFVPCTTEGYEDLYYIKSANSGKYMSKTSWGYTMRMVDEANGSVNAYNLFDKVHENNHIGLTLVCYDNADRSGDHRGTVAIGSSLGSTADGTDILQSYNGEQDRIKFAVSEVTSVPVKISSANYATLHLPFAVNIPSGVRAFIGVRNADNEIVLDELNGVIPAQTPVILAGDEGNYTFEINYDDQTAAPASALSGTLVPYTIADGVSAYILKNGTYGIGLYKVNSDTDKTIGANKAYFQQETTSSEPASFAFNFDDVTGINQAAAGSDVDNVYYDLNGRRVLYPVHGIYVKGNGQKVYIK